jgi:hypothetical protein
MVITVAGPPMSPRLKYTSTRKAASIAACGSERARVSEAWEAALVTGARLRSCSRPAAAIGA